MKSGVLQGWSQEGSSGDTSATWETSGDSCWGSLLFCFAAWIQWALKMRWSVLKHSFSLWNRNNQVNLCPVIINFSSNSSVKKKQILTKENLPNAWTPTPMDPMEKNELTFLESSRALMAIINWKTYPNIISFGGCHIPMLLFNTLITDSFITQNVYIYFFFFTVGRTFQEVKTCKEGENRKQLIEMCLIFLYGK